ncbi:hypothetical protein BKA70DRAFT_1567317 [Coprinopsis sp. MPI-PUGE-AT-0042]|nr:hypothetical protein BKA70DRAFT_1567317 [Coprinopsis sp. MPI-PUGE-AT-0042]
MRPSVKMLHLGSIGLYLARTSSGMAKCSLYKELGEYVWAVSFTRKIAKHAETGELPDRVNVYEIHDYLPFLDNIPFHSILPSRLWPLPQSSLCKPATAPSQNQHISARSTRRAPIPNPPIEAEHLCPLLTYVPPPGSLGDPHGAHGETEARAGLFRPDDDRQVSIEGDGGHSVGEGEGELDSEDEDENCVTRYETPTLVSALHHAPTPGDRDGAVGVPEHKGGGLSSFLLSTPPVLGFWDLSMRSGGEGK